MTFDDGIVSTHREVEAAPPGPWLSRIGDALRSTPLENPLAALRSLVERGLDDLPLPGSGRTLCRFRSLAAVAAHDLSLVKLYEGHTDALAILEELGGPPPPRGSTLGTWAAEARGMCVVATPLAGTSKVRLNGRKAWCSGAAGVSHAVVTVWGADNRPWLALVDVRRPGITVTNEGFHAVGMAATQSVDVVFEDVEADLVGEPGAYLERVGFWHGAVGIAACWYGGAQPLADALARRVKERDDVFARAHLGAVDVAMNGARALLHEAAATIDDAPRKGCRALALRARSAVESAVTKTLDHVGRALGATPFCRDARFAHRAADLPVFVRQSHAEHDLASLGALVSEDTWRL